MSEKDEEKLIEFVHENKTNNENNEEENKNSVRVWDVIVVIVLCFLIPQLSIPIAILSLIDSLWNKKNFIKVFYKSYLTVFLMCIIAGGGCLLLFWGGIM